MGCGIITYVQRKIYLYNVTVGLYMLDWWERYLFSILSSSSYSCSLAGIRRSSFVELRRKYIGL
ncbi:hypothetical protein EJ110_NYTH09531 [Nymphaea thermarum]|nr:hypothetical protein EJ110_NYTH09531 [Nymphaea thermarum]